MSENPEIYLDNLIANLRSPYGAEKSIKIFQSKIFSNRLLLSIHKDALGDKPDNTLLLVLNKLGFPNKYNDHIVSRLKFTDIIHFGYEDYGQGYFYKCYLEFSDEIEALRHSKLPGQSLVHYAIKWDPQNPSRLKFSHYHLQPAPDLNAVKRFLAVVYSQNSTSVAYRMILEIISMDEVAAAYDELMLMSVIEEDNERYSFDINLYNAEIHLAAISSQLVKILEYFSVDMDKWAQLYGPDNALQLGHLAGGLDGNSREFFTVYFGVKERGMNLVS